MVNIMVDLMGDDITCDTCYELGFNCCYDAEGKTFCSLMMKCPYLGQDTRDIGKKVSAEGKTFDAVTIKDMSTHLHELGDEVERFSNVKLNDKAANDILKEMELTLQHLGQDTRDIGKKVSNEKDYIHSEHFWNKTAGYLEGLSDSVHRINTGIKKD